MKDNNEFTNNTIHVLINYVFLFFSLSTCFILFNLPIALVLFVPLNIFTFFIYLFAFATFGPALGAVLACMIHVIEKKEQIDPFRQFFIYYKKNFKSTIKLWIPFCIIMTTLLSLVLTGGLQWLLLTVFFILIITTATIINVKFDFKVVDIIKLGFYFTIKRWGISLANTSVFAVSLLLLPLGGFIALFFHSIVFYIIVKISMPIIAEITESFLKKPQGRCGEQKP